MTERQLEDALERAKDAGMSLEDCARTLAAVTGQRFEDALAQIRATMPPMLRDLTRPPRRKRRIRA